MELSLFLAKFFGIYFLILALLWLVRKEQFEKLASEIFASIGLLGLTGIISLVFGIAIVVAHPVLEFNWRGVITFIGYLSIFQGIMRIGFPRESQKMASTMLQQYRWILLIIITVLGVYLTYSGFFS